MTNPTLSPALRAPARFTTAAALGALFLAGPMAASAHAIATAPPLGTASAFSVLAGAGVTNTGPTTIDRSVGTHPTASVTGRNTMTVGGTVHRADAVALQAKEDLTNAYDNAFGQSDDVHIVGDDLVGLTLTEGIYKHPSGMGLTGNLRLDGDADSVWVFQAGTTLITGEGASITFSGGANACNVFWQVGSSATLATGTSFAGTIMAMQSISMKTGATIRGRTLARNGAVTLDTNVFTSPDCDYDETVTPSDDDEGNTDTAGPVAGGDTTPDTTGGDTTGGDTTGDTSGGDTTGGTNSPRSGADAAGTDTPSAANQVATTPAGSVDTGFAGTENRGTNQVAVVGWALAVGFGGLALIAVRRRRVM